MANASDETPGGTARSGADPEELRIDDLPAPEGVSAKQEEGEDALRGGAPGVGSGMRTSPALDVSDPASDVIAPSFEG
jgi:hypothetical protein